MTLHFTTRVFCTLAILFINTSLFAQCENDDQGNNGVFTPDEEFDDLFLESDEYGLVAVTSGNTYEFSTCDDDDSDVWWDNSLTLRATNGDLLAFNDDFCDDQAFISWVATFTGQVEIHLNRSGNCGSSPGWADGDVMIREIVNEVVDCSPVSMVVYQDDCEVTANGTLPVIGFDFDINGPCDVTEFCSNEEGDGWICYDLEALGIQVDDATDLLLSSTTPGADYEFYFTTSDGTVSSTYTWTNGACECIDVTFQIDTDCWGEETAWELLDENGNQIALSDYNTLSDESTNTWAYCLPAGCYDWVVYDAYGDGLFGSQYQECSTDGSYSVTDANGNVLVQMATADFGSSVTETFCVTADVPGCTDSNATNYDATATSDDGSCSYMWYSVADGDASASVWSADPNDNSGIAAVFGENSSFSVRNGHTVTVDDGFICNNLTVENVNGAGNLQFAGDHTIEVRGDLNVSGGIIEDSEGGFLFNGSSAQNLTSDASLNDITVNNSNGLNINADLSLAGRLTIDNGNVSMAANTLTLLSTASRTASIGQIAGGSTFSGQVTLQRYIPSGIQNWVNLGNAITGNTLEAWNDDVFTTGFEGSQFPNYELNNVQGYDETVIGLLNDGWSGATSVTDMLSSTRGYMVYMTGTVQNMDVTGNIQQGGVSVSLNHNSSGVTANDGWELVSNVYPSEIDFEALHDASSNIGDTYYVYDAESGAYLTYTADLGVGSANRYISSSQSFWVQTTGASASLEWRENQKSDNGSSFERSNGDHSLISFSLSNESTYLENHLVFEEEASATFEAGHDAVYLGSMNNEVPEMALVAETGELLVVDRRPAAGAETTVGVNFEINEPGAVTFAVETMQNVEDLTCIFIEDVFTGAFYPVSEETELVLNFDETFDGIRLLIHHALPLEIATSSPECEDEATGSIELNSGMLELNTTLTDMNGTVLFEGILPQELTIDGLEAGIFTATVSDTQGVCPSIQVETAIAEAVNPDVSVNVVPAGCNEAGTGEIVFDMIGNGDFSIELMDGDDIVVETYQGLAADYTVGGLDPDFYTAWVTTSCNTGMQSYSLFDDETVEIEVAYNEVILLQNGTALLQASAFTDNAESWYWTINGNLVNTLGELAYAVTEPGVYTVAVTAYNATCSETVTFDIIVEAAPTNISEVTNEQFEVYHSGLQLTVNVPQIDNTHMMNIYDISGRCVEQFTLPSGAERTELFTLSGLSTGIYVVELTDGQSRTRKKIIIG